MFSTESVLLLHYHKTKNCKSNHSKLGTIYKLREISALYYYKIVSVLGGFAQLEASVSVRSNVRPRWARLS